MSGDVIAYKDLRVAPQGEVMDFTFYNKRYLEIAAAINDLAARQDGFDATSGNLVALGLQRINDTLGPFLTSLQDASQLGFLVCEATGIPVTFYVNVDVQLIVNSAGKSVFTPTPWLLAVDENDYTNWAILSLTAYSPTTGVLACGCVYTTQNKGSARWSVSCNSAMIPAELNVLAQCQASATAAAQDATQVQTLIPEVQQLIQIVQSGPVVSVAGRAGAVVLTANDIVGLNTTLAGLATVVALNNGLSTKQNVSAILNTFAALASAADKLPYFSGPGAMTLASFTAFARTLLAAPDAPTASAALGLGDASTYPASDFATPAQVTTIIGQTNIHSNAIIADFDDQTGTAFTPGPTDVGTVVTLTNASPISCTLRNDLWKGWNAMVYQGGAGQVTFTPAAGATLRNRQNQTKTAGQYAMVSLLCVENPAGNNAVYVLGGDTA